MCEWGCVYVSDVCKGHSSTREWPVPLLRGPGVLLVSRLSGLRTLCGQLTPVPKSKLASPVVQGSPGENQEAVGPKHWIACNLGHPYSKCCPYRNRLIFLLVTQEDQLWGSL